MSIKRLPFKIPEYPPRVTWASASAREVWEPRIRAVSDAWQAVERDSVAAGVRPSALQNVAPDALPELIKSCAAQGLVVLPLDKTARSQGYQAASQPITGEWDYRAVVTKPELAAEWAKAWGNDDATGRLLGTPECCRAAFQQFWVKEKWMDLTVPTCLEGKQGYNGLLRWLGIRGVSYMPCSQTCTSTLELAAHLQLMLPEPVRSWHHDLLSFPTLYTSLHGIAEITTPILRMSVASDALAEKVTVRHLGTGYPAEAAQGLGFPYRNHALAAKLAPKPAQNPLDNGFSSREAQDIAHNRLLKAIGGPWHVVLDLGCGDGALLAKVPATRRVGVEMDPMKATKAKTWLDRVVVGDCTNQTFVSALITEEQPDLVIAQNIRNPLDTLKAKSVLTYSYDTGELPRLISMEK